ncbi:MAG: asparaginase [Burkholderiaceae bacterium]|nr:asparaginase [Burkholderiaceae bacterium]
MDRQKIVVLGTGGTIAGTSATAGDNVGYTAAQVGVAQLLDAIPALSALPGMMVVTEQVAQIDSKDMDFEVWRALALRCAHYLADPSVQGVVITHGTDTLEETAWFLHETLDAPKPVVLTCAMRPATALTPDGPQNVLDAVAVALTPGVAGVFAVAAGEIHGARQVQKVHPYRINAFGSGDAGPLGWVEEATVRWAHNCPPVPTQNTLHAIEKIANLSDWPAVEIVMNYAGASGRMVDSMVNGGVQGIVVACTGNGTIHHALEAGLLRALGKGVRVVRSTRCPLGQMIPTVGNPFADSQGLSPVKARVSMMLDLL